jgi:hypothetical protein
MIWAIVSSVFVIYLYRKLNAAAGIETGDSVVPANLVDRELAGLDSRLDALESIVSGTTRRIAP